MSRDPSDAQRSLPSVGDQAVAGVRWIALGRLVVELLALGVSIVLARLIAPAAFGQAAVAAIVSALALGLMTGGFGSPVVQRRELTRPFAETAAALSLAAGVALTGVVLILAPAVAPLFGPGIEPLMEIVAPAFVIAGVGCVPQAVLQRRLDFKRLSGIEILAALVGTVTSLVAGLAGLGGAAIVLGLVATSAALSGGYLLLAPWTAPRLHRAEVREVLRFGAPASGSSILYTASRNVDYAVLGAQLGPTATGLYWRAYVLAVDYQGKISGIMQRLAFPVLSRASSAEHLRRMRGRMVRVQAVVVFPLLGALIIAAPALIPWVYGDAWAGAVVPAQVLAMSGMAMAVATGTGPLMLAIGRPGALLAYNLASFAAFAALLLVLAPAGLVAVCAGVTGFRVASLLLSQYLLVDRVAGIRLLGTLRWDVLPAAASTVALLAASWATAYLLDAAGAPEATVTPTAVAAGVVAYLVTLRVAFAPAWAELMSVARRLVGTGPRLAPVPDEEEPRAVRGLG
jgi:O-antigen/teichoic acid export membrane protein